jgi:hypothetical protein
MDKYNHFKTNISKKDSPILMTFFGLLLPALCYLTNYYNLEMFKVESGYTLKVFLMLGVSSLISSFFVILSFSYFSSERKDKITDSYINETNHTIELMDGIGNNFEIPIGDIREVIIKESYINQEIDSNRNINKKTFYLVSLFLKSGISIDFNSFEEKSDAKICLNNIKKLMEKDSTYQIDHSLPNFDRSKFERKESAGKIIYSWNNSNISKGKIYLLLSIVQFLGMVYFFFSTWQVYFNALIFFTIAPLFLISFYNYRRNYNKVLHRIEIDRSTVHYFKSKSGKDEVSKSFDINSLIGLTIHLQIKDELFTLDQQMQFLTEEDYQKILEYYNKISNSSDSKTENLKNAYSGILEMAELYKNFTFIEAIWMSDIKLMNVLYSINTDMHRMKKM